MEGNDGKRETWKVGDKEGRRWREKEEDRM